MRLRRRVLPVAAALGVAASSFLVLRTSVRAEEPRLPAGIAAGEKPGEYVSSRDGAPMVLVPATTFVMGVASISTSEDSLAMPDHEVKVEAFFADRLEVTNGRYAKFLRAIVDQGHATCPKDEPAKKDHRPLGWGTDEYRTWSDGDDRPVVGVDWWDARAYCAWAGKRLPVEAEWELAARGTDERTYPWGDQHPAYPGGTGTSSPGEAWGNWNGDADGFLFAAPGGRFPQAASPFGLLDVAGNVWEWTESPFTPYPGAYPTVTELYPEEKAKAVRVFRGGSFDSSTMDLQTTHRHTGDPLLRRRDIGFRGVLSR